MRGTRKSFLVLVGLYCTMTLPATTKSDVTENYKRDTGSAPDTTEIVVLGTLHGRHQENKAYSIDILRAIIVAIQPSAILVEMPPEIGGVKTVKNGRIADRYAWNENMAANLAADGLGVALVPYDRKGRNEFYKETDYFKRQKRAYKRLDDWAEELATKDPESIEVLTKNVLYASMNMSQGRMMENVSPEIINSSAFDLIILNKKCIQHKVWPKMLRISGQEELADEFLFIREEWEERNRIMAENIIEISRKHAGKRLVVLCGVEHRYILRDLLSKVADVSLREFYEMSDWKRRSKKVRSMEGMDDQSEVIRQKGKGEPGAPADAAQSRR